MTDSMESAAQWYAQRVGWPVIPLHGVRDGRCTCGKADCGSPGKHPRTRNGLKDASTDPNVIAGWWQRWPEANIGIVTGHAAGTVVLDVDPRHGGDSSLAQLVEKHGPFATVEAQTGGGGQHFVFAHPGTPIRNSTNLLPGIDVRGDGGYIVVAPSTHASGNDYAWAAGHAPLEIELAPLPTWLHDLMTRSPQALPPPATPAIPPPAADRVEQARCYMQGADPASEGNRNNVAFNLAGHLLAFQLSRGQALELMREWNQRCSPPLSDGELAAVVSSAATNGTPRPPHSLNAPSGRRTPVTPAMLPTDPRRWPEPQPLPDDLPPVQPFDYAMLPEHFRPWIQDIAERIQCPPDFPAVAAMVALAIVVGRKVSIRPKRQDDWLVVPNLWGSVIGPPSVMKTPAVQEPLRPLVRLEMGAKEQFEQAQHEYAAQQLVSEQKKQVAKTAIRKAVQGGDSGIDIALEALEQPDNPPVRRRYLLADSTVEKLGEILNQNPNGVGVHRDEMIGLLKSLDRDGQEGARAFYLEAWNGTGRFTYDRIGRGTLDIEACCVSIIGSIQPGPLQAYLHGAVSGGEGADGLMQRFQLAVYPDVSREWRNVDRWPDSEARNTAYSVIDYLDTLDVDAIGVERDELQPESIPFLRFTDDAQFLFDSWRTTLEQSWLRSDDEHEVMVAHLAKYRSLIPSLALLIHLAECRTGPVEVDPLAKAIRWGEYLRTHARRIYSVAIAPDIAAAVALAKKIEEKELSADGFAMRDVYRHGWIGLNTRELVRVACEILCDLDWLAEVVEDTGGRPRSRFIPNPRIWGTPPKPTPPKMERY